MIQGVQSRLSRGFAAHGFGQVISIIIQVVTVPLLLNAWGKTLFGEWLLLSTIPTYFNLSDLGFASAASSEMTMLMARGEREETIGVYQSAWLMVTIVSALIALGGLVFFVFAPISGWLNITVLAPKDVFYITVLFLAQIIVSQQLGIFSAAYHCDGNFAPGIMLSNVLRLAEFIVMVVALRVGYSPVGIAAVVLIARLIGLIGMWLDLRRRTPWLSLGVKAAKLGTVKRLVRPAFAFNGMVIGYATNLQGILIVVGACFGPASAALFSTMRTFTRLIWQVANTISVTVGVELSTALGRNDKPTARLLHQRSCQIAIWLALFLSGVAWLAGQKIFDVWTHGRMIFDRPLFTILLLVVVVGCFWATSMSVQISINRHQKLAVLLTVTSLISIGLAWVLGHSMGLVGVGLSLLFGETMMVAYVVRDSLALLDDNMYDFVRAISVPPVAWLWRRLKVKSLPSATSESS